MIDSNKTATVTNSDHLNEAIYAKAVAKGKMPPDANECAAVGCWFTTDDDLLFNGQRIGAGLSANVEYLDGKRAFLVCKFWTKPGLFCLSPTEMQSMSKIELGEWIRSLGYKMSQGCEYAVGSYLFECWNNGEGVKPYIPDWVYKLWGKYNATQAQD